ncbi:unnamed protein product [Rhodiola kirilowii]
MEGGGKELIKVLTVTAPIDTEKLKVADECPHSFIGPVTSKESS